MRIWGPKMRKMHCAYLYTMQTQWTVTLVGTWHPKIRCTRGILCTFCHANMCANPMKILFRFSGNHKQEPYSFFARWGNAKTFQITWRKWQPSSQLSSGHLPGEAQGIEGVDMNNPKLVFTAFFLLFLSRHPQTELKPYTNKFWLSINVYRMTSPK